MSKYVFNIYCVNILNDNSVPPPKNINILELDTGIKNIGWIKWEMVIIGLKVEVSEKIEWWRTVISWEDNVGFEVVMFWDKS